MLGGRDDLRSQTVTDKWVPKSATKRDAHSANNSRNEYNNKHDSDDVVFRTIRGILNKLTPQTFDKLTDELIRSGLDSQARLKGLILLIFEKALQEPKYVCLYAALCKKISTKVPNFDATTPDGQPNVTTFQRLLLSKCQDEFENRTRASAYFDNKPGALTPDEEEEKMVAKQKMLGNINFIGELCKLQMLTHTILYKCTEELIRKAKAEDLECLAQIMMNCGHLLDTDKGKKLMDQYFVRITSLSKSDKLPPRIRFMLQDVVELRENGWHSRGTKIIKEKPKLIDDIRKEAAEELGLDLSENDSGIEDFRPFPMGLPKKTFNPRRKTGMEDVFGPVPFAMATTLGTGPGVITHGDKKQVGGIFHDDIVGGPTLPKYGPGGGRPFQNQPNPNAGYNNRGSAYYNRGGGGRHQQNENSRFGGGGGGGGHVPNGNAQFGYNDQPRQQQQFHGGREKHPQFNIMRNQGHHGHAKNPVDKFPPSPIAPRFQRQGQGGIHGSGGGGPPAATPDNYGRGPSPGIVHPPAPREPPSEPILRPVTKGFPTTVPARPSPFASAYGVRPGHDRPPILAPAAQLPSALKSVHLNGDGPASTQYPNDATTPPAANREKKANIAELIKKVDLIVEEYLSNKDVNEGRRTLQELDMSGKQVVDVVGAMLNKAMDRNESERELIFSFICQFQQESPPWITPEQFLEAYHKVLDTMSDLEADIPRIKSYVASFAAKSVQAEILTLAQIAEPMSNGNHYPFLLLVLQQLSKTMEKVRLSKLFEESKIDLLTTLPKADRSKSRLDDILEERCLSFLFPLLKIQAEMMEWLLQPDATPEGFLNWILEHVDKEYHGFPGFINALMTVLFRYITQDVGKASDQSEKAIKDAEFKLLEAFKPVLEKFFSGNVGNKLERQMIGLYAIQAGWYAMGCPKVTLLRWFMNLYELEVFEEDAFLRWKEDLSNDYPGKGKALFQVHQWLIWLETVEDEEEDDEE